MINPERGKAINHSHNLPHTNFFGFVTVMPDGKESIVVLLRSRLMELINVIKIPITVVNQRAILKEASEDRTGNSGKAQLLAAARTRGEYTS